MNDTHEQVESPTYHITAIGFDGDGITYLCWSGGKCYWFPASMMVAWSALT